MYKEIVLVKDLENYASVYSLNKNAKDCIKDSMDKELVDMSTKEEEGEVDADNGNKKAIKSTK